MARASPCAVKDTPSSEERRQRMREAARRAAEEAQAQAQALRAQTQLSRLPGTPDRFRPSRDSLPAVGRRGHSSLQRVAEPLLEPANTPAEALSLAKNAAGTVASTGDKLPKLGTLASRFAAAGRAALLPSSIGGATQSVAAAVRDPSGESVNQAVGKSAGALSATLGTVSHGLRTFGPKLAERGVLAHGLRAGARFVPGLNVAAAAADGVWAASVIGDSKASVGKKASAGVCAVASAVSATNVPVVSQVGAAVASAAALVSSFF